MSNNENTKAAVLTQIMCDGASARSQAQVTFSVPVGINLGDSAAISRILSSGGFEIHKQARGMGLRRAEALVFQCVCVCVYVYVREREEERGGGERKTHAPEI